MKVYFIDKNGKNSKISKAITEQCVDNFDIKDTYSFRTTKNDYVILSEFNNYDKENDLLTKFQNLIIISKDISKERILDYINKYKVIDVISASASEKYIANRVLKLITN